MIIDFDAHHRAQPNQLESPSFDEPAANLTSEWFRVLMMFPESRRLVCPTCRRYWYFDDEYIENASRPGYVLGCLQCLGPLWRIYEKQPDISGMTMIPTHLKFPSQSQERMRKTTYLNS